MGLYDRPYLRDDDSEPSTLGRYSMVTNLIIVNVVAYVIEILVFDRGAYRGNALVEWLGLDPYLYREPWKIWQPLTYGFLHDPKGILHLGLNMYGLWLFGREVENIYGRIEFLKIYLSLIVLSGFTWMVAANLTADGSPSPLIGASGAVVGVMILYVIHFPKQTIYVSFVLPMPMWLMAVLYLLLELAAAAQGRSGGDMVAHVAHLAGAGFAFVYYRTGWHLGRAVPGGWSFKPRLRVHDPDQDRARLNQQVDAILEKISREGEASLSRKERRTLEKASRRFQRRQQ